MIGIQIFAILIIATMFAAVATVGLHWLLLQTAFQLMRPAARRTSVRTELVRGTAQLARAFAAKR